VKALRSIYAVARADFLERVRRYSFLVTLIFAVCLGYATAKGKISLQLDEYRGVYTSAWIGTLVALVTACFVSLVGFYIVKNSVERDRSTGVGQILVATPLSKLSYAFGKFLSNLAVLTTMLVVIGPMNHTPGLDFTGAANGPLVIHYAFVYAAMGAALLVFAFFTRARQLRSN
jgi:ABC-type transport system involved in multi-copper enzyme maturation permease subunit